MKCSFLGLHNSSKQVGWTENWETVLLSGWHCPGLVSVQRTIPEVGCSAADSHISLLQATGWEPLVDSHCTRPSGQCLKQCLSGTTTTALVPQWVKAERDSGSHLVWAVLVQIRTVRHAEGQPCTVHQWQELSCLPVPDLPTVLC
jgi:hypothetical protein